MVWTPGEFDSNRYSDLSFARRSRCLAALAALQMSQRHLSWSFAFPVLDEAKHQKVEGVKLWHRRQGLHTTPASHELSALPMNPAVVVERVQRVDGLLVGQAASVGNVPACEW